MHDTSVDRPVSIGLDAPRAIDPLTRAAASPGGSRRPQEIRSPLHLSSIWRAYDRCPVRTRVHAVLRYLACPYQALAHYVPREGTVLDIGCGHGLLALALDARDPQGSRRYVGIDHAPGKIASARTLPVPSALFLDAALEDIPSERYDCVTLVDVLYTVPLAEWPALLSSCRRVLRPGGVLVAKEAVDTPRWKYWLTYLEEMLAVCAFKLTKGGIPHFESVETHRRSIESAGFHVVSVARLDAWRPHAHCLFVAEK